MIDNFETVKVQLKELSSVINSFKSEEVQLRIIDLIFGAEPDADEESDTKTPGKQAKRKRRKKTSQKKAAAGETPETADKTTIPRRGRKGAVTILDELISEGYFMSRRAISDVIEYAKTQKVRTFKASDLSGPLGRFVKNGKLQREKNNDGQYQYYTESA